MATSSLVPDTSGPLDLLLQTFGTRQSRAADRTEKEKQEALQRDIDILTGGGIVADTPETKLPGIDESGAKGPTPEEQEKALLRLAGTNPPLANSMRSALEFGDKLELAEIAKQTETGTRQALLIQRQPDFISKKRALTQLAQEAASKDEDFTRLIELSNMSEPQLNLELDKMILQGADLKTLTADFLETEEAATPGGEIIKASEISDGFIVRQQPDGSFTKTKVLESTTVADAGKASAVTTIYKNGAVVQALPNGKTQVRNPAGEIVEGNVRLAVLKDALDAEIEFGGLRKGTEAAATASIRQSEDAFKKLAPIKLAISNIDKAVSALDEGATTGAIVSKFPSIRTSSVKLDNVQKAMGLDVVGSTTFGALSKGELDLALAKAIPLRLRPKALRQWLVEKKAAQEKLAAYIEDAAIFLGTPGNTIAGWLEAQEAIQSQTPEESDAAADLTQLSDEELLGSF